MFKNPPEHPAWWLIDQVGLRGYRARRWSQISEKHTNFFLNLGSARSRRYPKAPDEAGSGARA